MKKVNYLITNKTKLMKKTNEVQTVNNQVAQMNELTEAERFRLACQNFTQRMQKLPTEDSIDKTADGKAQTVVISHIEMLLDENFFGLWETENFKWAVIANEVVGSIDLIVTHPVTGKPLKRVGAASIQIMVDKGTNPLDVNNKKSNALDMGFPKLKAECLKNAAQSLGKLFGRDLNRKKQDFFQPLIKQPTKSDVHKQRFEALLNDANSVDDLGTLKSQILDRPDLIELIDNKIQSLSKKAS